MTLEEVMERLNSFVDVEINDEDGEEILRKTGMYCDYDKYAECEVTDIDVINNRLILNIEVPRRTIWADEKMDELMDKGKENWDVDDWDAYNYIEQFRYSSGYYEE